MNIEVGQYNEAVSFKLDTGAQVNVFPLEPFLTLKCDNLEETTQEVCGYGGKPLKVEGKCTLSCQYKERKEMLNPHMTPSLGIEPAPHCWEASALT